MKRNNWKYALGFLTALAVTAACTGPLEEDGKDEGQTPSAAPVFPEMVVDENVAPGDTLRMTLAPDHDWTASVSRETLNWFWIDADGKKDYKVRGKAGETYELKVVVSPKTEFGQSRSCTVTMEMAGISKEIARYVRQAQERTASVHAVVVEDGLFKDEGNGTFVYSETPSVASSLIWPVGGSDFRTYLRINANCPWIIGFPDWLEVLGIPSSFKESVDITVKGISSAYPLDGASGKISFFAEDNGKKGELMAEVEVSIPGCRDRLELVSGFVPSLSLSFNHKGLFLSKAGYVNDPFIGTYFATEATVPVVVGKENGKYADLASWVKVTVSDWSHATDADVLQNRDVEVTVEENAGEAREAALVLVPASLSGKDIFDPATGIFSSDRTQVKEEFADQVFTISQDAYVAPVDEEFITMIKSPADLAQLGASFETSDPAQEPFPFFEPAKAYTLTYSRAWSSENASFSINGAYDGYTIYDASKHEVTDKTSPFWLSISEVVEGGPYMINMADSDVRKEGFIAFYKLEGFLQQKKTVAVVRCIYDKSLTIIPGSDNDVRFTEDSEPLAAMAGARLEKLTSGNLYDDVKEYGAPVYHLVYTQQMMPMSLIIPSNAQTYTVNPWTQRLYFRINDLDFDETVGRFDLTRGSVEVYMELERPEDLTNSATILFYDGENQGQVVFVLQCTLDLTPKE